MSVVDKNDFRIVRARRKPRRRNNEKKGSRNYLIKRDSCDISEEEIIKKIQNVRDNIKSTEYFNSSLEQLKLAIIYAKCNNVKKLVCFGLGAFSTCIIALHQLAFILEIQNSLGICKSEFYDPILSQHEKSILNKFGWDAMLENCEGKYPIKHVTLLYFPHCPKQLTNNFLWSNWNSSLLSKVIIIGNSFSNLKRDNPERLLREDAEYIVKITDYVHEFPLENTYHFPDVFNDTSIHAFAKGKIPSENDEFWIKGEAPIYCDVELITKDLEAKLFL